jgi:hypothetical protein
MKKLIVLLLAFAMVGAVSAQVTTAVALSGKVTLVDQAGNSLFDLAGAGADTFTLSAKDKTGKYGFSLTDGNVLDGFGAFRDWNVWTTGKYTKVIVGSLRNGDFRLTQAYGGTSYLAATDRISGYGLLVETLPVNGLTFGVNLPIGTTAGKFVDVLQNADLGAKYSKDAITAFAMLNLDLVAPKGTILNAGAKYTGVKNLPITALFKGQFDANTYAVSVGTDFTGVEKLDLYVEADYQYTAGANGFTVFAEGDYAVTDALTAIVGGSFGDGNAYDVYGEIDYACLPGTTSSATIGFNGAFYANLAFSYNISL